MRRRVQAKPKAYLTCFASADGIERTVSKCRGEMERLTAAFLEGGRAAVDPGLLLLKPTGSSAGCWTFSYTCQILVDTARSSGPWCETAEYRWKSSPSRRST